MVRPWYDESLAVLAKRARRRVRVVGPALLIGVLVAQIAAPAFAVTTSEGADGTSGSSGPAALDYSTDKTYCSQSARGAAVTLPSGSTWNVNACQSATLASTDIGTTTPTASAIPVAGTNSKIDVGWLPSSVATASGTTGYLAKFASANSLANSLAYETNSKIGIGTTAPANKLSVVTAGDNDVGLSSYSTDQYISNYWLSRKSHCGTIGQNCTTVNEDVIGTFQFKGVNQAGNFELGAYIQAQQVGTAGAYWVPMKLIFATASSSGSNSTHLVLNANGTSAFGGTVEAPNTVLCTGGISCNGTSTASILSTGTLTLDTSGLSPSTHTHTAAANTLYGTNGVAWRTTATVTNTHYTTESGSTTKTATRSSTATMTQGTLSLTSTATATTTTTGTFTRTAYGTLCGTYTHSGSATITATITITSATTAYGSQTVTATQAFTATWSVTATQTDTRTNQFTYSRTATSTGTSTWTATKTVASVDTYTDSNTRTDTATLTASAELTYTDTSTTTATASSATVASNPTAVAVPYYGPTAGGDRFFVLGGNTANRHVIGYAPAGGVWWDDYGYVTTSGSMLQDTLGWVVSGAQTTYARLGWNNSLVDWPYNYIPQGWVHAGLWIKTTCTGDVWVDVSFLRKSGVTETLYATVPFHSVAGDWARYVGAAQMTGEVSLAPGDEWIIRVYVQASEASCRVYFGGSNNHYSWVNTPYLPDAQTQHEEGS